MACAIAALSACATPLLAATPPTSYAGPDRILVAQGQTSTTLANGSSYLFANDGVIDSSAHFVSFSPSSKTLSGGGIITVAPNGSFSVTRGNQPFNDLYNYTLTDSNGKTVQGTVTIGDVPPINTLPSLTLVPITLHTNGAATMLNTGNSSLLDTASDTQGNLFYSQIAAPPSKGTVVVNQDGSFKYTHTGGAASTSDSFQFKVCENGGSCTAAFTQSIVITSAHPPSVVNDAIRVTSGGTTTVLLSGSSNLLANDSDLDAGETATLTAGRGQLGGGRLNGNTNFSTGAGYATINSIGTFSYTNTGIGSTSDSFQYYACDATYVCRLGVVKVTVLPSGQPADQFPAASDDAIQVAAGGSATTLVGGVGSVLANDTDPDAGDTLTAYWVSDPEHGILVLNTDGSFSYANTTTASSDSFQYQACDNKGACKRATVNISIGSAALDHAPVVIDDAIQVVKSNSVSALIGGNNSVLGNDFDSDQPASTLQVSLLTPLSGLTLNANGTFSYTAPASAGVLSFYYQACDDVHACAIGKVTITVTADASTPINRAPWVVDDAIQVAPGSGNSVTSLVGGANSLALNDSDPDGSSDGPFTVSARSSPGAGTLNFVHSDGTFKYTAPASSTTDNFIYQICDKHGACTPGIATVTVTPTPVNHLPAAGDDAIQVMPGSGEIHVLIGGPDPSNVTANDLDPDGDALTVKAISPPLSPASGSFILNPNGFGAFGYTPPATASSDAFFAYEVCDTFGACAPGLVTINVDTSQPDSAPVAYDDLIMVKPNSGVSHVLADGHTKLQDNDSDADGQSDLVSVEAISPLSAASGQAVKVYSDGTFDYTAPTVEMLDSFKYQVCDSFGACSVATVNIVVSQTAPLLSVDVSAVPGTFVGSSGSYPVTITNAGNGPTGGNITLQDSLPAGITLSSATGAGWACSGTGNVTCVYSGPPLAAGTSTTVTLGVGIVGGTSSADNTATVFGGGDSTCPVAAHCKGAVKAGVSATAVPVLNVTKLATPGTFLFNGTGSYQITVSNSGSVAAVGPIVVRDTLPAGISLVSASGAGWACTVPSYVNCTYSNPLPPSSSTNLVLNVAVAANATTANNTATIQSGDQSCPAATHCSGTVLAGVSAVGVPVLSVTTQAAPATFVVGQAGSYPITVTNTGTAPTNAVISLQDPLPPGLTFSAWGGTNWVCSGTNVVSCTYAGSGSTALAPGMSTTVTLSVNVGSAAVGVAGANNTATASGGGDTTCPAATHCKGSVSAGVSMSATPILAVSKSTSPGTFVGGTGSYPVTITNTGTVPTSGSISLQDALPPGISLANAIGTGWTCSGSTLVNCTLPGNQFLVAGASTTVVLNVTVASINDPSGANNTVTVSGGGDATCPTATHCSGSVAAGVSTTPVPILSVTKSASPGTFVKNQSGSYTINVTNTGSVSTGGAIMLHDPLPVGITLTGATGTNWSCSGTSVADCTFSAGLAPDASTSLILNVSVGVDAVGVQGASNTVTASGGGDPTCPGATHCRGSVIAGVSATAVPVLSVTKFANPGAFEAGKFGSYQISIQNTGKVATSGAITVQDVLPSGVTLSNFAGDNWECSGTASVICSFSGSLKPQLTSGNQTILSLGVAVDAGATIGPNSADNTATASGGGDQSCNATPVASHCSGSVTVAIEAPLLNAPTANKTFTPSTIPLGGVSTMMVTLSNSNAVALTGVSFADSYPVQNGTAGMKNTSSNVIETNSCGGSLTAMPDSQSIALTGATIPANGSCSVVVHVTGSSVGTWVNHTGAINTTTVNAPSGVDAAGTLNVVTPSPDPLHPAPIAVDDALIAVAGQAVSVVNGTSSSVRDNDANFGTQPLEVFLHGPPPAQGSLVLSLDGTLTYTSTTPGATADSFQYRACDPDTGFCSTATVNITILAAGPLPQIQPPVAAGDGAVVNAGGFTTIVNGNQASVLDNDFDPNQGGTLSAKLVGAGPSHGTVDFNLAGQPSGSFKYSNNAASAATQDEFFYEACDSLYKVCAIAKVSITVLPAGMPLPTIQLPVVADDGAVVQSGNSTTKVNGSDDSVLKNDSDPNGGTLSSFLVPGSGPSNGQLPVFGLLGDFQYQNSSGNSDGFQYQACDDKYGVCSIGNVTITVTHGPPPVVGTPNPLDDTASVAKGGSTSNVNGSSTSVLDNDGSNPNGGNLLAFLLGSGPTHGTFTVPLDSAGKFTYKHNGDSATADAFIYEACDPNFGVCKQATVNIAIDGTQGSAPTVACVLPRQVYSFGEAVSIDLSKLFLPPLLQALTYSTTGQPSPLAIQAGSSLLTGTPTTSGVSTVTLKATASQSLQSASQDVVFQVLAASDKRFHDSFDGSNKPCQ